MDELVELTGTHGSRDVGGAPPASDSGHTEPGAAPIITDVHLEPLGDPGADYCADGLCGYQPSVDAG